jgi:hypothetical protein
VFVVHGSSITEAASITDTGYGVFDRTAVLLGGVSSDHAMAAFALPIPVDPMLAAGVDSPITVTVTQAGVERELTLQVEGLDELATSVAQLDAAAIAPAYSTITIGTNVTLVGAQPARLVATAAIEVTADVTVTAGRCAGGPAVTNGSCGDSGGRSGASSSGGGGGGNSIAGMDGQGTGAGSGGARAPAVMLTPLGAAAGNGGGGGANQVLDGGGAGGAGGGVVELTSGGSLSIGPGASIAATGQNGAAPGGLGCGLGGGAGGGGAGGAILLRAGSAIAIDASAALSVAPGLGGVRANCGGGDGAPGVVRADGASLADPGDHLGASVLRGAMWRPDAPTVVTGSATVSLPLTGRAGITYFLKINTADPEEIELSTDVGSVEARLEEGSNSVCALVLEAGNLSQPESINCISIAYLP